MNSEFEQFRRAYASLNAAQKQAVDTIEGPVMVIAGPGTGKTQILTLRIANILQQTDTKPENILALTFTESGAQAMRERLRRYLGSAAYQVGIYTFHGLAGECIRRYPDAFPKIIGGTVATELEQIDLISMILSGDQYKLLKPIGNPEYYLKPIIGALTDLKQENISPDDFATWLKEQEKILAETEKVHNKGAHKGKVRGEYTKLEKSIAKNYELLQVYRAYQALLADSQQYDYTDMILELVHALETDESLLRDLQEQYQYLLADEHQDVNGAQNAVLDLLASYHEQPNLFVVGDEKQAIYRFQGASLENFLYFEDRFAGTTTIALTENYRSSQPILDAAHELIAIDEGPSAALRVPLTAVGTTPGELTLTEYSHESIEEAALVQQVQEALAAGVPAAEIAVIVRTNQEVMRLTRLLRSEGVMAAASADTDILEHPITQSVLALIEAVTATNPDQSLATVLHGAYWQLPQADVVRLLAGRGQRSLQAVLATPSVWDELGIENPAALTRVVTVLDAARAALATESPQTIVATLLQDSGLRDQVLTADPMGGSSIVRRLYDEIERLVVSCTAISLPDVLAHVKQYQQHGLPLTAPAVPAAQGAVQVMTAHKAKGLEFAHVFVPHITDTLWGGRAKRNLFSLPLTKKIDVAALDVLDDERRLLYVALTRAKQYLHISYSTAGKEGKAFTTSRLLTGIPADILPLVEATDTLATDPAVGLRPAPKVALKTDWLAELFLSRGLSATGLNNYLQSPWQYLYRNLLRVPETPPLHLRYGTVVHEVLERATRQYAEAKTPPTTTELQNWLHVSLKQLPLTTAEHTRLHEQALSSLGVYLTETAYPMVATSQTEVAQRVILPLPDTNVGEITLTGLLDRIDLDESGQVLRVVDYKTGKPKTRGYIEGTTKDSDGGYKRQLVFYALLLSLQEDERMHCRTGVLSFVEPDTKGGIREEVFEITDEEIASLKREISAMVQAIEAGTWLQEACDPDSCDYCHLAEALVGLL